MVGNIIENNSVTIAGKIVTNVEFSHEVYGEAFYSFVLDAPRLSSSSDRIPVTISERLAGRENLKINTYIEVEGQFRSYNNYVESGGNKLILTVFAREITFIDSEAKIKNPNQIYLDGYICKSPVYRTTPFGREITDILLAVNRPYNKSDYIPCIAWGRNARYCGTLKIGDNLKLWGRIQSRSYQKKLGTGDVRNKVAYEVSITKLEVGNENNYKNDQEDGVEESF